ncbi:MAG: Betaine aldehyde dehydrogenase [Alphaproteobacteria bacterium MarineAlpha5_Bin8]|nr:MAG: Betaine aldehyde dehydrogenase [Alphaproteobacteria bacterium MarineAlpha5_Bin8]PPR53243.1 MAG: Betaine aldehyde dehydrogenase [Alphaproteobacteria bacterium MarineAlpha5_Bin6]
MEVRNYINGEFIESISKKNIAVINPANQQIVNHINEALDEEIELAFTAAKRAFNERVLLDMNAKDKSNMMRSISKKLREYKKEGSTLLSQENGKTIDQCAGEFEGAANIFDYYAGLTDKIENKLIPSDKDTFNYTLLEPFGVSLQIVPWNYPIILFARSVAVSLVVGNTIVIKPPELCPISSNIFGKIFNEVMLPKGVVNILHGYGDSTGKKLVKHKNVNHVVFTGSPEVATEILKQTADRIIPCHLELGGKSAAIIYPDADIDQAVASTVNGIFKPNAGQICVAMSRVIIHPKVKDEYINKLINKTKKLKIGPGDNKKTEITPLISQEQLQRVSNYCQSGIQSGAELVIGGQQYEDSKGNYFEPTIFDNVDVQTTIAQEEIFGPVTSIFDFENEDEAINIANSTDYGLASGVFTSDDQKAKWTAERIEAGVIWHNDWFVDGVNLPGGGYKKSGYGRDGGIDSLYSYGQTKRVSKRLF